MRTLTSRSATDASAFGTSSETLRFLAVWTEALHARGELSDALALLLSVVRAERCSMLRLFVDTLEQDKLANSSVERGRDVWPEMSLSQCLLGEGIGKARPGSVWYLSDLDHEPSLAAGGSQQWSHFDLRTREAAVMVLEPAKRVSYLLEVHFLRRLSASEKAALRTLTPVLAEVWQRRRPEVIGTCAERRRGSPRRESDEGGLSFLSASNPFGLSKSEYRVCVLLAQGFEARSISRELRISESTVRSHLRNIYAKTESRGQLDLMRRLLDRTVDRGDPGAAPRHRPMAESWRSPSRLTLSTT